MLAGLDQARGRCDAVVLIDADLQHPPELIPAMVRHWQEGAEMVTAIRSAADQESTLKILSASGFYSLFNRLTDSVQLVDGAGDFRLLSQPVVRALTDMREGTRFSKALFPWTGFRSVDISYDRPQRSSGATTWNARRLFSYALDGIFSFSVLPLRIWIAVGTVISLISLVYALVLVISTLLHGIDVPGYASLIVAVLFLGGVQLIGIGILGEYIGRIFEESKRRPPYLVRRISTSASRARQGEV
jgi:glycosyltransferase involved in cell wall biosynthesis